MKNKLIILIFSVLCLASCGKQEPKASYFREIDNETFVDIVGKRPIADSIIPFVNQYYKFTYDRKGRATRIDYISNELKLDCIEISYFRQEQVRNYFYKNPYNTETKQAKILYFMGKPYRKIEIDKNDVVCKTDLTLDCKERVIKTNCIRQFCSHFGENLIDTTEVYCLYDEHNNLLQKKEVYNYNTDTLIRNWEYDKTGNQIKYYAYRTASGFKSDDIWQTEYDKDNNKIAFYVNSKRLNTAKYDNYGNVIEQTLLSWLGVDEERIERYKYDEKGNEIETSFYDKNYQLQEYKYCYSEAVYFGEYEHEDVQHCNVAIVRRKFNDKKQLIEISFYDKANNLSDGRANVAIVKFEYDGNGKIIHFSTFDKNGNPSESDINKVFSRYNVYSM